MGYASLLLGSELESLAHAAQNARGIRPRVWREGNYGWIERGKRIVACENARDIGAQTSKRPASWNPRAILLRQAPYGRAVREQLRHRARCELA